MRLLTVSAAAEGPGAAGFAASSAARRNDKHADYVSSGSVHDYNFCSNTSRVGDGTHHTQDNRGGPQACQECTFKLDRCLTRHQRGLEARPDNRPVGRSDDGV
eukprot:1321233-Pyramimonas_sp.AAC.1